MDKTQFIDLLPTRQTLLERLKELGDDDSWRDFFNTYWTLIYEVALKSGLTETEAEEVVQETVISVARKIPSFQYDPSKGSFKGWLLNLTRWRITDQLRKRPANQHVPLPNSDGTTITSGIEEIGGSCNFETVWDQEWERNQFALALDRVKAKVKAKQFQIFDLYALQGWSIKRVTATLGVSVAQVYVVKHRLANLLKKELKKLVDERANTGGT